MTSREREGMARLLEALTCTRGYAQACQETVNAISQIAETPFAGLFSYSDQTQIHWVNHNGPSELFSGVGKYGRKYPARDYIMSHWPRLGAFKPIDLVGQRRWQDSEFYTDFMKQHRFEDHALCFSPLSQDGRQRWLLAVCHDEKNAIPGAKLRMLSRFMPHVVQGLDNLWRLNSHKTEQNENIGQNENFMRRVNGRTSGNVQLSLRELEILGLIAKGMGNKEIAHKIHISYNTARTHVQNIFSKLKVSNRIEAINKVKLGAGAEYPSMSFDSQRGNTDSSV